MTGPGDLLRSQRLAAERRIAQLDADIADLRRDRSSESADDEHDPEGTPLSGEWSRLAGLLDAARRRARRRRRRAAPLVGRARTGCARTAGAQIPPHGWRRGRPPPAVSTARRRRAGDVVRAGGIPPEGLRRPSAVQIPARAAAERPFDGCCAPILAGTPAADRRAADALALLGVRRRRRAAPRRDVASAHPPGRRSTSTPHSAGRGSRSSGRTRAARTMPGGRSSSAPAGGTARRAERCTSRSRFTAVRGPLVVRRRRRRVTGVPRHITVSLRHGIGKGSAIRAPIDSPA